MKSFKEFKIEKCKSFGFTFTILIFLLSIYDFFYLDYLYKSYVIISLILIFITLLKPALLKFFGFYWERFGIYLGIFFSPIILTIVYLITILPVNLIIRILGIDLLKKKYSRNKESYWEIKKKSEINFKDQF